MPHTVDGLMTVAAQYTRQRKQMGHPPKDCIAKSRKGIKT